MQHIGIMAHSADGAALCFLEMVREASRRLGPHRHPEITLSILPMGSMLEMYARNDLPAVRTYLERTAHRLADAGCDFFVCPDNTAHLALDLEGEPLPLPRLHIAEIVAERARAEGRRCVGVLGTRRRGAELHGDSAAHHPGGVAAADPGLDPPAGQGGGGKGDRERRKLVRIFAVQLDLLC
jgi:aspartate/glutamate racemase